MNFYLISSILIFADLCWCKSFETPNVKIYGGTIAEPGQFPSTVSINVWGATHLCGATIVHEEWIVTAAHCVTSMQAYAMTIIAGTTVLNSGGSKHNVTAIISHPNYTTAIPWHDVALIRVEPAFVFDRLTAAAALGAVGGGETVNVLGWGATEEHDSSHDLLFANVTVLTDDECTELSQGGKYVMDRCEGQVCAISFEKAGPCFGDSGGPLVHEGALVGIVSYGVTPCAKGFPDVYTRVDYYRDWIEGIIAGDE